MENSDFVQLITELSKETFDITTSKGFNYDNKGEQIALMHSELSEGLEAIRKNDPPDEKCPQYSSLTVELADTIIRILGFSEAHKLPIGEAILAKIAYNKERAFKHGGKNF